VQIKDRQQFLTVLAVIAVALLVIDKLIAPPLTKFWDARAQRIRDLSEQVKTGEQLRKGDRRIRGKWADIQAATLTNDTTAAEHQLYSAIDRWSQSSGMTVNSITPQWKDSSDSSYKTIECRVDASGNIDRVTRFLYDLENDPMALKLQSIELTASDNTGQQIALGVQVSGLVLTPKQMTK
jgi:hypothetical protein